MKLVSIHKLLKSSGIILYMALFPYIKRAKNNFLRYHIYTLAVCLISLSIFLILLSLVIRGSVNSFDLSISQQLPNIWNPILNSFLIGLTNFFTVTIVVIISLLILGLMIYQKKKYPSWIFIISLLGGFASEQAIKFLTHRIRPGLSLIPETEFSFPSGHATLGLILFALIIYAFRKDIKNAVFRQLFILLNIILFIFVGFTRVYLNVHWATDVLAGFALGIFWLTLSILIVELIILPKNKSLDL